MEMLILVVYFKKSANLYFGRSFENKIKIKINKKEKK